MTDDPESLVLRYLRRLESKFDAMAADIADIKAGQAAMRHQTVALVATDAAQEGTLATIQARLDRLEKRLDLRD